VCVFVSEYVYVWELEHITIATTACSMYEFVLIFRYHAQAIKHLWDNFLAFVRRFMSISSQGLIKYI